MMQAQCAALLALLLFSASACGQTVPSWLGKAASGADIGAFARLNPFKFLSTLTDMSPMEQRLYLQMLGAGIHSELNTTCNIFGGESACQKLPEPSKFGDICKTHDMKVDCAYYDADAAEAAEDPIAELKQDLSDHHAADLAKSCPQCFDNMRRMWCAQTAPKCGSFQSVVERAILPAMAKVSDALDKEENQWEALSAVAPALVDAMALSLPCREMCEAVLGSCSCGKERQFGDVLQAVLDSSRWAKAHSIPAGLSKSIFGELLDRPLCSLFAPSNRTGFAGHCDDLPSRCTDERRWCHGDNDSNPGPALVEELLAAQLAEAMYGWIGDPVSGLLEDRKAAVEQADRSDVQKLEKKYLRKAEAGSKGDAHAHGTSAGVIVMIVCLMLVSSAFGALAYHKYTAGRGFGLGHGDGYIPMHETQGAAYEPPSSGTAV